eukprot:gene39766-biopygen33773
MPTLVSQQPTISFVPTEEPTIVPSKIPTVIPSRCDAKSLAKCHSFGDSVCESFCHPISHAISSAFREAFSEPVRDAFRDSVSCAKRRAFRFSKYGGANCGAHHCCAEYHYFPNSVTHDFATKCVPIDCTESESVHRSKCRAICDAFADSECQALSDSQYCAFQDPFSQSHLRPVCDTNDIVPKSLTDTHIVSHDNHTHNDSLSHSFQDTIKHALSDAFKKSKCLAHHDCPVGDAIQ